MPSMMIHLLTAHKLCVDTEPLFCIGTIAPDAVTTREEKDITHFRTICDRERALLQLAQNTDKMRPFDEGVLLHLFLDWCWDNKAYSIFANTHQEENWFFSYRHEIALAGAYIYHNSDWCENVWQKMLSCPCEMYGIAPGVCGGEVAAFLKRNYKWHKENNIGPSEVYPPMFVEEFTSRAAEDYGNWRNGVNINILDHMGA